MKRKVLVVDDDLAFNGLLGAALEEEGYEVVQVYNLEQTLKQISEEVFDCLILDVRLPDGSGLDIISEAALSSPVIVVSAHGDINTAIDAVKKGAFNFLEKPFDLNHALLEVKRAIEFSEVSRERDSLADLVTTEPSVEIIGKSKNILELKQMIAAIAPKKVTVLLEGESGTGKEVVARSIHQKSGRGKFVPINCGAIPENLFESELFGYEKGSFTGAMNSKPGLIEESHRGTLFLDEISEMPLPMQVKLLRVLETSSSQRLGGTTSRKLDLRVIAATNRDLEVEVSKGNFRSDLYYRLNVVKIKIDPLREKREDIPILIHHFLPRLCEELGMKKPPTIPEDFMNKMKAYDWPGNIRELRNRLLSILAVNGSFEGVSSFAFPEVEQADDQDFRFREVSLDELERRYISWLIDRQNGNKTKAASILQISKSTLYEKLKRWSNLEGNNDTS
ncbi:MULTISPECIES: sigma-54 dependent transcriptional regulator [Mesotoga]|uniref:Response regulator with CheY-like receiver, AAA-type ATPase, and DNA-binding domains n=2 Tax=Mesotoga TaxID=1184396 RepID=I2F2H4_9BACT|nr:MULTISPECIES: sigma-54 dependent transcriptional regulator [Mesotoga]MCP5456399.1 sigma-54-dependent Fis family transcriptional regulator [Thermotogota bacterium]AFK06127.1 response regulator with CheY-like receiver, AAA-type ATPase, and DNA-binding domains [Mesotoga prima MesG1.Ag.4.2]MCB1223537.1 sigma-54-dependent Fis family transcriptional regulator [Mesotoga sp.]MCP5460877.1 sigma-54-dependent Fis family transcriptional regulator [Thermotogota bacterium]PIJ61937.1 Fis family transcript